MIFRIVILVTAALVSGLAWDCGSDIGLLFNIAGRPIALALLCIFIWPDAPLKASVPVLLTAILLADVISSLTYALQTDPKYVVADGETQLWIVISFAIQCIVALIVLFFIKRIKAKMLNRLPVN